MGYELFAVAETPARRTLQPIGLKEEEAIMHETSSSIKAKLEFKIKDVSKIIPESGAEVAKVDLAKGKKWKKACCSDFLCLNSVFQRNYAWKFLTH